MKSPALFIALGAPCLAAPAVALAEPKTTFSSGVEYSSGDYGSRVTTEIVAAQFSARITEGAWSLRASIPYLHVVNPNGAADDTDGGVTGSGTVNGLGDASLSLTRTFKKIGGSDAFFAATGRVYVPTGSEHKGLGSGEIDAALLGEWGIANTTGGLSVNGGRRFRRDDSQNKRRDGWQAGVSGWLPVNRKTTLGVSYSWREASKKRFENPSELAAFAVYRMSANLRLSVNAGGGLSDGSPDVRTGVRLSWRLES